MLHLEEDFMSDSILRRSWHDYISEGIDPKNNVRSKIYNSWIRSKYMQVDPWQKKPLQILSGDELKYRQETHSYLISVCLPYMESLYAFVKGSGFVIALSDPEGILLKIIGDEDVRIEIRSGGFIEGANYGEKSVGTNAIGTALYLEEPFQVYSYEHYCRCAQVSTCSCALIKDADNQIIGSLTLVGYDYNVHSHTLGMAVAAAEAIHNNMVMKRAQQECLISDAYKTTVMDCISQGVLAVDSRLHLTFLNHKAMRLLSLNPNINYIGCFFQDIIASDDSEIYKIFLEKRVLTDHEIMISTKRGILPFSVSTRIIRTEEERFAGVVIVFDEIKRVRKIMQRMSGAIASTTFEDLVGKSPAYMETIQVAKNAALSDFNVLLLGESGTGKDVFAQAIHNYSNRSTGPFLAINCSAIPRELIGSELFGYVEGAYTGARKGGSTGKFELADSGTIFLDEIGDMPLEMQGHLLRVIEDRRITRIGGHNLIPIDVRIIAATNKNLIQEVAEGRFRQDLYYRLNVISIHMVPLRERLEDLPLLIERVYEKILAGYNLATQPISHHYMEALQKYSYPGNIRELQNIIERTLILSNNGILDVDYLPADIRKENESKNEFADQKKTPFQNGEQEEIYMLLVRNKGNISKTAKELGIARSTLYRKIHRYGFQTTITTSTSEV